MEEKGQILRWITNLERTDEMHETKYLFFLTVISKFDVICTVAYVGLELCQNVV